MKQEFLIERQGKQFVLWVGILDLAHTQGLKSIKTELVQVPSEANNRVAICTATVTMEKDGVERTFTGIGDAAPNNVAPAMQTCLIRMAETRAKARALRDATNVGVAAFEELGDEDAQEGPPERGYRTSAPRAQRQPSAPPVRPAKSDPALSTVNSDQLAAIRNLSKNTGRDASELSMQMFNLSVVENLTSAQAGDLIRALNEKPRAAA